MDPLSPVLHLRTHDLRWSVGHYKVPVPDRSPVQPQVNQVSDESLVERVKQREVAAFTLLYDRYAPAVYALAAHQLSPADAEEIVQEAFLRLWRRAEQFDPGRGAFKAWFMTLVRNHIFDHLKRRSHEERTAALDEIERLLGEVNDPEASVAEALWEHEQQAAMVRALHELPPEQRRAIVLAYFGGLSQSAIAAELGWPLGTVKKRIRLGLQKLRGQLMRWRQAT
ncbi:MAG: RNA polymerase subunit sigma-24 [Chloroflexi bacterium]|nr:MAG: RNA polymerase subunit sigma-24 [Chloroflexota bacterium]